MSARVFKPLATPSDDGRKFVSFRCPGCDRPHIVEIEGPHAWQFNGDMARPTISPSYLLTKPAYPDAKPPIAAVVCHSFINDGQIQFLSDCTHALAGQTVPLPPVDAGGVL